jgi:hypothetical protein
MRGSSLGHSSAAARTRRLGSSSTRAAATGGSGNNAPTPPPPRPPPLAAWARRLAAAGAGAALLVAAAPALLSTPWGTRVAASAAGAALLAPDTSRAPRQGGHRQRRRLEIDRLSLAWGAPVVASGVRVYDADADPLLSAERVSTAEPLLPVARALLAATVGGRPLADGLGSGSAAATTTTSSTSSPAINISITNPVVDASLRESRDGGGFRVAALFGAGRTTAPLPLPTTTTATTPSPLSVADASAPFSADIVVGDTFSVCMSDGLLRLPEAMAEALVGDSKSGRVHLVAVAGERAVRAAAAPDGERLLARSPEVEAAAVELGVGGGGGQQPPTLFSLGWLSSSPAAAAAAAEGAPPPAPFAMQLLSPRCAAEARGWWVMPPSRGGGDAYYVLERPALAAVELTPELASRTLARANPLLSGAVGLVAEGGTRSGRRGRAASSAAPPPRLSVAYSPEGGMLPADRARVSVAPARVAVQIAGIAEGGLSGAASSTAGATTSPVGIAAALLELCGVRVIGARGEVLEARVARMDVDVDGDVFKTRRVRVALGRGGERGGGGGGGGEVSVALWGRYDAQSDQVAMCIGLPARAALKAVLPKRVLDRLPTTVVGVRAAEGEAGDDAANTTDADDPDPPLLTLDVAGPADAPRADWQGAARQLASLSAGAAISAAFGVGGGGGGGGG